MKDTDDGNATIVLDGIESATRIRVVAFEPEDAANRQNTR
jgi:hypothetical protein